MNKKSLIAYFSREGNNYVSGSIVNLTVGNTEVAANMIFSFLEAYDFAGKTIIPFCAHEGSSMGYSESDLERLDENLGTLDIELTTEDLKDLNEALSKVVVVGDRYPAGSDYAKRAGR
jgi:diketogulonate reductase-like aldo/keto reductase